MFARVNGAFRPTEAHVRVRDTFMRVKNIYARVGNVWRPVWAYTWQTDNWDACSASCGGGTQTRTVTCTRNDGRAMPDAFCTDAGPKPAMSQSCNTHPCYTYSWSTDSWGSCSRPCGGGTQYRTVTCRRNDGQTVSDSYCGGGKPSTSQYCNNGTCRWYQGAWSGWTTTCGNGSKSRSVYCQDPYGSKVADSYCGSSKPSATEYGLQCTGTSCKSGAYFESAYISNKVKHGNAICFMGRCNWTYAEARDFIISRTGSVYAHYANYNASESVCGHSTCACCTQQGRKYCA